MAEIKDLFTLLHPAIAVFFSSNWHGYQPSMADSSASLADQG